MKEYKNKSGYTEISKLGYYNSKEWKELRKIKLSDSPLCEVCLKNEVMKPAEVVDHIIPITPSNTEHFYQYSNLQSLCNIHHWEKTHGKKTRYSLLQEGKKLQNELEND